MALLLCVARTVSKLSNGVAAAGPPFRKTSSVQNLKTGPDALLIGTTKYASGVPGELYLCNRFLRTRRSYTVKLRACSYHMFCCHGTQSSSAISPHAGSSALAARLRDGCSEVSTVLRDGRSEASTILKATTAFQSSSAVAALST